MITIASDPAWKPPSILYPGAVEDTSDRGAGTNQGRILVLDDNDAIRFSVSMYLSDAGYTVKQASTLLEAQKAFDAEPLDAAIVDYMLPDGTALDLLQRLKERGVSVPVVLLTSYGSIELAVKAVRAGAENFLTKPLELSALLAVVQRITDGRRAQRREAATRSRTGRNAVDPFLGTSNVMRRLAEDARRVAASDMPVLIQGETGSGKGALAAWIHANGPRASEALVDLNCAGLQAQFLEDELFGHERGAFTGAHAAKPGLLDLAHRGTLFLDELGDMDARVQPKLLKVLEEKRFRRLGDVRDRVVEVRLIAATSIDLQKAVHEKTFRSDLYFRMSTLPLFVPPLRDRPDDIPVLAEHFLSSCSRSLGPRQLAAEATNALQSYPWPGNVRELRNVLERAALLSDQRVLSAADLRLTPTKTDSRTVFEEGLVAVVSLEENERRYLVRVLEAKSWQVDDAAAALGIPLSSFYQRLKRLGISRAKPGAR